MRARAIAAAALLWCALPASADAAYGVLRGRVTFYQFQGNYCPTGRDCTGAIYPQSQYQTYQPVRNTLIWIEASDGALLGGGATDANGNFNVSWYTSRTSLPQARVMWQTVHKDNRFAIRTSTGATNFLRGYFFTLVNGDTLTLPEVRFGAPGAANPLANVYDGAVKLWDFGLSYSNLMVSRFSGVAVRAFSTDCPSSCAQNGNLVKLDPNSAYSPQARIMHELGHIASYKSHGSFRYGGDYCYPNEGSCAQWSLNSTEWGATQFEEGYSTFVGDSGLYFENATQPHTCNSSGPCAGGVFNTEWTPNDCVTGESRWPVTVTRYLWDIFDTSADIAGDTFSRPYYEVFDTLNHYPDSRANGGRDEPWCSFLGGWWICSRDGRSATDYLDHLQAMTGTNTWTLYNWACNPP